MENKQQLHTAYAHLRIDAPLSKKANRSASALSRRINSRNSRLAVLWLTSNKLPDREFRE